jgi:MerR family transcriptional regulator/heat shock protein HspR
MLMSSEPFDKSALDDHERPMYLISVVAEILSVHPQTLRVYEREGLISPERAGGQRLYSRADVEKLGLILDLTRNLGLNRAGVDIVLRMRNRIESLQRETMEMMRLMDKEHRDFFEEKLKNIFEEE